MYKKFPLHEFLEGIIHETTKENVMAKNTEANWNLDLHIRKTDWSNNIAQMLKTEQLNWVSVRGFAFDLLLVGSSKTALVSSSVASRISSVMEDICQWNTTRIIHAFVQLQGINF